MRWVELVVGIVLAFMGAVWLLQGLNVLPGSGMSGQAFWAVVGLIVLVVGLGLAYLGIRGPRVASRA